MDNGSILQEHPDILDFIRKISTIRGIEKPKVVKVTTNAKGEGFLGDIFVVDLQDETRIQKELHVVIKSAFKDEKVREAAPIRMAFENEIRFYSQIVPEFEKLEANWDHNLSKIIPECHLVSCSDSAEMLALENLKSLGFEVLPKSAMFNEGHVRLLFKTFGQFHAYSLAMKDQQPELYRKLAGKLHNIYYEWAKPGIFVRCISGMFDLVHKRLSVSGKCDGIIEKLEKYLGESTAISELLTETCVDECDYSVLTHGDCWSNNFMFKYKDGNTENPTDIRLLDFQFLKPGNPVCDLSFCLYSGASKEVYDKLEDYLKIYHESLSSSLKNMGCEDPEKLYPFEALQNDWKRFSKFGLLRGIILLKMKLTPPGSVVDYTDEAALDDERFFLSAKFDEEQYYFRMEELLQHLVDIDVL